MSHVSYGWICLDHSLISERKKKEHVQTFTKPSRSSVYSQTSVLCVQSNGRKENSKKINISV